MKAEWHRRAAHVLRTCQEWRATSDAAINSAHPEVATVLRAAGPGGANVAALDVLMEHIGLHDRPGQALLRGMPLVGTLDVTEAPTMRPVVTTMATVDPADLAAGKPMDNARVRQAFMGPPPTTADRPTAEAIWQQTKADISAGLISQPAIFRPDCSTAHPAMTVRFGVKQVSSKGRLKVRCIDDFRASNINGAVTVMEKLRHDHHDDLLQTIGAIADHGHVPQLIKADFRGAYRTIPLDPAQAREYGTILTYDTDSNNWVTAQQHACPFGAVASVYHWERTAGAITSILRWIGLPACRYVDDLFMAVPSDLGRDARTIMETVIAALGWTLEPSKTEGPTNQLTILGVDVTIKADFVHLRPDEAKSRLWLLTISDALLSNRLTPKDAEKLAGRLNFAAGTAFGRVGRAYLRAIYHQQHSHSKDHQLNDELRHNLMWWQNFLTTHNLHRAMPLRPSPKPVLLVYTDATGGGSLGYAVYDVAGRCLTWGADTTDQSIAAQLHERQTQVNAHETIAALWAVCTLQHLLPDHQIHLYIDNTTAESILRSGYSTVSDLNHLAAAFWLIAAAHQADIHIIRVPSKSNPADAPSRGEPPPRASQHNQQPPTWTAITDLGE